jgi:hypothetical protein
MTLSLPSTAVYFKHPHDNVLLLLPYGGDSQTFEVILFTYVFCHEGLTLQTPIWYLLK